MAASPSTAEPEPGAPVPRDAIDPELVKLARTRPKIGLITAAGVIAFSVYFLLRLGPDRSFGGEPEQPAAVTPAQIAEGKIGVDRFISVEAAPMMSHAIRVSSSEKDSGHRLVPVRGTNERVWLALSGDGWENAKFAPYTGRLRRFDAVPFAAAADEHARENPRPTFATAQSVLAGIAGRSSSAITTVAGDTIAIADGDRVAFDAVDPARSTIVAAFVDKRDARGDDAGHGPLKDAQSWIAELARHGITATVQPAPADTDAMLAQVRLDVAMPVADVNAKLEAAKLPAARVERVTTHHETTWGKLRTSPPGGLAAGGPAVPAEQVDLVGLYVQRGIAEDAYVLLAGEQPQDYWYVMPITVVLAVIGLLFVWALVRAARELLPGRVPEADRS